MLQRIRRFSRRGQKIIRVWYRENAHTPIVADFLGEERGTFAGGRRGGHFTVAATPEISGGVSTSRAGPPRNLRAATSWANCAISPITRMRNSRFSAVAAKKSRLLGISPVGR